ncbi:MAG: P-type conjugative transfer protein TrbL [Planctomycetota bacterium]|jgi:type IV secretion system protein TrbL|nr:P-type conjugative transfer protein TrbL [Planctomycetota bacterium]
MIRAILLCVLLCLVVPAVVAPARAAAAEKILDATIDRYMEAAAQWEPRLKQAAKTMFWILATISMVFTFAFMFARGNTSFGDFFGEFLRFIVTTGFFYWLLDNGSAIAKAIITSFAQLGLEASSTYQADLSPSNLLSFALDLIVRSCGSFGEQDIATSVIALLLSIAIAVLFAIIAAMMVLLLCSAWVLVYAGVIYLGFGGGRWTSDIAINYFKTVLGLAVQTFTFCLLVGIGQGQIERLLTDSQAVKSVTVKGYVYDSVISTTSMTITEGCIILIFTVVLFMLVKTVPQMVAGVASGASTGGIHLGGSGSAMAGAAAVASGGAMIAMQAAGAGMAMASAYQQTKENKANGAGMFAGGGGGGLSGGLSGAMSTGLRSAGDFMANLASGAWDTTKDKAQDMKESVQSKSVGGKVSSNIDAERAANKAKWAADDGKKDGSGDAGGSAPSGGEGNNGGGDASGGVSGSSGSGGDTPPPLPISDSASSAANSTGSVASDGGGTGGGVEWGGSISGAGSDAAQDEWNAAINNYDPSKVGLPDS